MNLKPVNVYIYGNLYYLNTKEGNTVELKFISLCYDNSLGNYYAFRPTKEVPKEIESCIYKHPILGEVLINDNPFIIIGELDNYIPPIKPKDIIPNNGDNNSFTEYIPTAY